MTQTWSGWNERTLRGSLGKVEEKIGLGKNIIFPLGLSVRTYPGAEDSSREGRAGWREGDSTEPRACPPRGARLRYGAALPGRRHRLPRRIPPPGAGRGRGLLVSEDDTTRSPRLLVHLCCHGDDSILAAWVRPARPQSDNELGPLRKPLAQGRRPKETGCGSKILPWGRPAGPRALWYRIIKVSKHSGPRVLETTLKNMEAHRQQVPARTGFLIR